MKRKSMEKYINNIINSLEVRKQCYEKNSDTYNEIQNTINMLKHSLKL